MTLSDQAMIPDDSAADGDADPFSTNISSIVVPLPPSRSKRVLTWWRLAMITFVFTCSGPGGLEQVVKAGGPLLTFVGIFAMPVVYVIPQVVVVCELGAMMPTNAGSVLWIHRAFGRFGGFFAAWTCAISDMIDCATYPSFLVGYVVSSFWGTASFEIQLALRGMFLVICMLASLASTKDLSVAAAVGTVLMAVFVVVEFFAATPHISPRTQWGSIQSSIDWNLFGSSLLWMFTGWATLGSLSGEIHHSRVLYQGMGAALGGMVCIYLLILVATLTVAHDADWDAGYVSTCYEAIINNSGRWFGALIIYTSSLLYVSVFVCYSRYFWGVASLGWAPAFFKRELKSGAPHWAVILHAVIAASCISFDLSFVVQVEYAISAASDILMDAAFIYLRYKEPDLPRPYKVPGGWPAAWFIMLTKIGVVGGTLITGLMDWQIAVAWVGINLLVCVMYLVMIRLYPEDTTDFSRFDPDAEDRHLQPDLSPTEAVVAVPITTKLQRQSLYTEEQH